MVEAAHPAMSAPEAEDWGWYSHVDWRVRPHAVVVDTEGNMIGLHSMQ